MNEETEFWNRYKQKSTERRKHNRENSAVLLAKKGIPFESKNNGAHLIVTCQDQVIDFWPGTGKYIVRGGEAGRGVHNLLKLCATSELDAIEAQAAKQKDIITLIVTALFGAHIDDVKDLLDLANQLSGTEYAADARLVAMSLCQNLERFAASCED